MRLLLIISAIIFNWYSLQIAPIVMAQSGSEASALKAYSEGYQLLRNRQYTKAYRQFQLASRLYPKGPKSIHFQASVNYYMGICAYRLGRWRQTQTYLRRYLQTDIPKKPPMLAQARLFLKEATQKLRTQQQKLAAARRSPQSNKTLTPITPHREEAKIKHKAPTTPPTPPAHTENTQKTPWESNPFTPSGKAKRSKTSTPKSQTPHVLKTNPFDYTDPKSDLSNSPHHSNAQTKNLEIRPTPKAIAQKSPKQPIITQISTPLPSYRGLTIFSYIAITAGSIAIIGGAIVIALAIDNQRQAQHIAQVGPKDPAETRKIGELNHSAINQQIIAAISFAVGGTLAITGLVVLLTRPKSKSTSIAPHNTAHTMVTFESFN
jgi:hypothetical protein